MNLISILAATLFFVLVGCSNSNKTTSGSEKYIDNLYSTRGAEQVVAFSALYQTNYTDLENFRLNSHSPSKWEIANTIRFLFGPLVTRDLGGPQHGEDIKILRDQAFIKNGFVFVPYDYKALWLITKEFSKSTAMFPVPFQSNMRTSANWKSCGDWNPDHQTEGFFWYFWDPSRPGCDHVEGIHYQNVELKFLNETIQTTETYPEYHRMIRTRGHEKVIEMTFAFGYVEDPANPNPFTDNDFGIYEFRNFVKHVESKVNPMGFKRTPILQSEYGGFNTDLAIGARFTGLKDGVKVVISIVASAGVDQMMLFAESYAAKQEAFFSWYGHSRVGSGFDAQNFKYIVDSNPKKYKMSSDYQLIYWAGCNSYSYYTLPFFDMKAALNPSSDPSGTKNLDIISNGLPSYFSLNAINAAITLKALLNWNQPTSYQNLVSEIESKAYTRTGAVVLVNVLGDEDNE
jgi:hypothetical protein